MYILNKYNFDALGIATYAWFCSYQYIQHGFFFLAKIDPIRREDLFNK